jgi:diguanylate cyclase (GGDEF)-like protein
VSPPLFPIEHAPLPQNKEYVPKYLFYFIMEKRNSNLLYSMQNEFNFDGFQELIRTPLEKKDPRSFETIRNALRLAKSDAGEPFRFLVHFFIGKKFKCKEARDHWRHMIRHKENLEAKLGRRFGIQAAMFDYFDSLGISTQRSVSYPAASSAREFVPDVVKEDEPIARSHLIGNHLEIFKKEVFRAKRYKHSLSAIVLEIDDMYKINQLSSKNQSEEVLSVIVKIIAKTIRIVDILNRYLDDRFFIILPNTNKREATELAERIRQNIFERTKRIFGISGVTATLSVGQTMGDSNSSDFIKHLETILHEGKKKKCNIVYSL